MIGGFVGATAAASILVISKADVARGMPVCNPSG
jgi:hypothetical protein